MYCNRYQAELDTNKYMKNVNNRFQNMLEQNSEVNSEVGRKQGITEDLELGICYLITMSTWENFFKMFTSLVISFQLCEKKGQQCLPK